MSKIFVSILLLLFTFSVSAQEVKKEEVKADEKKEQLVDSEKKSEEKKSEEKKSEEKKSEEKKSEEKKSEEKKSEEKKSEEKKSEEKKSEEKKSEEKKSEEKKSEEKKSEDASLKSADAEKKEKPAKKYGASIVLDSALGQGTFVSNEYARNPMFAQTLILAPFYKLSKYTLGASISASMEYTDSDSTTHANQIMFSDLALSASRMIYSFETIGLSINGKLSLALPTSLASQRTTLIMAPSLALSLNKAFGDSVSLSYSFMFKKNFNQYESPVIKKEDLKDFDTYYRKGGVELLENDIVATSGNNVSFIMSHSFALSYSITESLSTSMSFAYSQAWTYRDYVKDEYTAENASTGMSFRDMMVGSLGLNWQIDKTWGLSFGVVTAQLPKTSDQKGFRFPWFNFSTPADNLSQFYLDINITF